MTELIIVSVAAGLSATLAALKLLHIFQLESYYLGGFFRRLSKPLTQLLELVILGAACTVIIVLWFFAFKRFSFLNLGLAVVPAVAVVKLISFLGGEAKLPLRSTPRMIRLTALLALVFIGCSLLLAWLSRATGCGYFLCGLIFAVCPLAVALAALVARPIEALLALRFKLAAKRKLEEIKPITVGITGSLGKTSVKCFLAKMLEQKYRVCASPQSYNTPMGLCRTINQSLQKGDEILIAEMGARRRGDIRELVRLIPLDVGIVTAVCPQHLESFKTLKNIEDEKLSITDGIKQGGVAAFNACDEGAQRLCDRYVGRKLISATDAYQGTRSAYYTGLHTDLNGSTFDLVIRGQRTSCTTTLLGEHNVQNITLAALVASNLGVSLAQIKAAIAQLMPVKHRLEVLQGAGGVTVIDDSYNANPRGVAAALEVLSGFPQRRIIVTPGMVELGKQQDSHNYEFGRNIARVCDVCVLVGGQAEAVRRGVVEQGFDVSRLHSVSTLSAVQGVLGAVARSGDTVLFCNDLPDNYL